MNNINKTKQAIIKAKLYDKYHRALKKIKSLKKNILIYISLPHVWILVIITMARKTAANSDAYCLDLRVRLSVGCKRRYYFFFLYLPVFSYLRL